MVMYEFILSTIIIGAGVFFWNVKLERITTNIISKYLDKEQDNIETIFIDPRS